ncbi:lysM and putative peptidoglycan-binding domain-containing protein 3 isoform X1 [Spodoptera frugiperda]|uniref:LysM and putative peptidoglycan-binding domain-containing protein 3 isoform X1 n=2 Tax=Spodoptera frugiperda TaxID=7108 RepID=A0A9R0EHY3_SPOFR|nr:lysM and putative peptidoglycan-binding domain-containing protein 3 isoform X1 [Spodoptera frugiperda]
MKQRARSMQGGDDMVAYAMGKKSEDGDHNEIQLHRIKSQEHFIEAQVQEGDTLQAIALRFYCSISELKRINHIHKDNEIFARRTIKVPVTPYSVLTELIPTQPSDPVPAASNNTSHTGIQELLNTNHYNGLINQNNVSVNAPPKEELQCSIDCNSVVMNSTLAPSVVPYTDSEQNEQATEDTQLLPSKEKISVEAVVVKELTSHGADFGLKWFHLVCCMLILGVVIPLVYVMFYLDKHEHSETDLPPLHSNR